MKRLIYLIWGPHVLAARADKKGDGDNRRDPRSLDPVNRFGCLSCPGNAGPRVQPPWILTQTFHPLARRRFLDDAVLDLVLRAAPLCAAVARH
jgi:hypothetical protein